MKSNCETIRSFFPMYRDHILGQMDVDRVEDHLKDCEDCRNALKRMGGEYPRRTKKKGDVRHVIKNPILRKAFLIFILAVFVTLVVLFIFYRIRVTTISHRLR